jgi:DNA-binding NarL/FixJ family response regulator
VIPIADDPQVRPDPGVAADDGPVIVVIERRPLVCDGLVAIAREARVGSVHGVSAIPAVPVTWISPLLVLLGLVAGDDPAALVDVARERLGAPVACALFCDDPRLVAAALTAEADGYLVIDLADSDAIADLIAGALAGERTIPPELAGGRRRRRSASILSERCVEVLRCLAGGQHDDEIAATLSISASCVRKHIRTAEERLEARTRPEALAMAIRAGIL